MLTYLAAPYSHPDPEVKKARLDRFCELDAKLTSNGFLTVSPLHKLLLIEHGHNLPDNWEYWADYGETLIAVCGELAVIRLDGWKESEGVQAEVMLAKKYGLEILYME